jgi:hypothetical protein
MPHPTPAPTATPKDDDGPGLFRDISVDIPPDLMDQLSNRVRSSIGGKGPPGAGGLGQLPGVGGHVPGQAVENGL